MIRDIYEEIKNGINVRQNLSSLRQELKEGSSRHAFLFNFAGECKDVLVPLLKNEDAKTRKNTALLLGELGQESFIEPLMEAYRKEEQRFVRSSYLQALKQFDYRSYLPELKENLVELTEMELTEENRKHVQEEKKVLTELILMMEGMKSHKFIGNHELSDIILLTNRDHINITLEQLKPMKARPFNAGIIAQTDDLNKVMAVRTFQEILFAVPGKRSCKMDAEHVAAALSSEKVMNFLKSRHNGDFPFYFRIELKCRMPLDKKSTFTKKVSAAIEEKTQRKLVNSTSHYEIEFRLIENKEGNLNILLKLYTLKDERFSYRKEVTAASIKPVNAALTVELTKKYMKEDAQVLDPFCGVGTMLIERHKAVKANTMYGIDIFGEAVKKARVNTEAAHQIVHYINRDFFDFKHQYLFDEIITDMPFTTGRTSKEEIEELYHRFFMKVKNHLKTNGILILYSHNKGMVRRYGSQVFEILEQIEINKKEETYVFVLKN